MKACHVVVCVAEAVLFKNLGQEPGAIFRVKKSGPQSGIVTNLPWRHWVDCCVDPACRGAGSGGLGGAGPRSAGRGSPVGAPVGAAR